jgi:hypothetical protein
VNSDAAISHERMTAIPFPRYGEGCNAILFIV